MKKILFILSIAGSLWACSNKKVSQSEAILPVKDTMAPQLFFPVTSFFKGQLSQFDSLVITPLYITTKNGKADSEWIKKDELKLLLQPFLTPEINETNLVGYFKESRFNDEDIGAITLAYEPIKKLPDSINIAYWNVYVNPETGIVNKIYLVKHVKENAQNITQQLTWKTGDYAEIADILDNANGTSEVLKKEKLIWNFSE